MYSTLCPFYFCSESCWAPYHWSFVAVSCRGCVHGTPSFLVDLVNHILYTIYNNLNIILKHISYYFTDLYYSRILFSYYWMPYIVPYDGHIVCYRSCRKWFSLSQHEICIQNRTPFLNRLYILSHKLFYACYKMSDLQRQNVLKWYRNLW
jgi:hypothetical protein